MKIWLDVPFDERAEAKRLGARWDASEKRWFALAGNERVRRWLPLEISGFPGEDRSFGSGLFVDLIPSTSWYSNARAVISDRDWGAVKRFVKERSSATCEACGSTDGRMDVHERWEYVCALGHGRQTLRRLMLLCERCHLATHYGFACTQGREDEAIGQLMKVRRESRAEIARHVDEAYRVWGLRSTMAWDVDLSILAKAGISIREAAGRTL